jgi:hypothetical protein
VSAEFQALIAPRSFARAMTHRGYVDKPIRRARRGALPDRLEDHDESLPRRAQWIAFARPSADLLFLDQWDL